VVCGLRACVHQPFGEHSRRIYLVWTNGEIDYERSYIDVFDFCRPSGALSIHTGSRSSISPAARSAPEAGPESPRRAGMTPASSGPDARL